MTDEMHPLPPMDASPSEGGHTATIYAASKTRHAPMWRMHRGRGWPIISTWLDEAGEGETADFADLWTRNVSEAARADAVILYHEEGDVLRGAFVEAGASLAAGKHVFLVSPAGDGDKGELGSFHLHPRVTRCRSVTDALTRIARATQDTRHDG